MSIRTSSWAWHVRTNWPRFNLPSGNQSKINQYGNGLNISPESYTEIIWFDGNSDGHINDADTDDATRQGTDLVHVNNQFIYVQEIGKYTNSTVTISGTDHSVTLTVWLLKDGSYLVRLSDADIPAGAAHSAITAIKLGTWDGVEYGYSKVADYDEPFLCFTPGTLIDTPDGPRLVEDLRPGDLVLTADHGAQPLRWIGRRDVAAQGRQAPVLIRKGALGNSRDLLLSPQHRVLLSGWQAELHAGSDEVLAAALHLVNGDTITRAPGGMVTYIHLLFDTHEIIWAEGIPTESFHPGAYALNVLDDAARAELLALFPELDGENGYGPLARPCAQGWEARAMAS